MRIISILPLFLPLLSACALLEKGRGDASLESQLSKHAVAGASVAVYENGRWHTQVAGLANTATGVPLTEDTLMHIGSITKVLNATLVMQLVDEGLVDLDAPISRYLPELRLGDADAPDRITVKMLLNHTSGIDGMILPDQGHDEETLDKGIARFAKLRLSYPPGRHLSYNNVAVTIAGYLVQRMRGMSWHAAMKTYIFEPLGLTHAATLPEHAMLQRVSIGHHVNPDRQQAVRSSVAFLPLSFAPAGATAMMSARDLASFGMAHARDGLGLNDVRILSARSARLMRQLTASSAVDPNFRFGLGWVVDETGIVTHSGGGPGINSNLKVFPEKNSALVVLTNTDSGGGVIDAVSRGWLMALAGVESLVEVAATAPAPVVNLDRYLGHYADSTIEIEILRGDGGLAVTTRSRFAFYDSTSTEPTSPLMLEPIGPDRFRTRMPAGLDSVGPTTIQFLDPDTSGRPALLGMGIAVYPRVQTAVTGSEL